MSIGGREPTAALQGVIRLDVPIGRQLVGGVGVPDEGAVGLGQPLGHRADVVAPQDVVAAVAVEVAAAGDLPVGADLVRDAGIAGEVAIGLAQPLGQRPEL